MLIDCQENDEPDPRDHPTDAQSVVRLTQWAITIDTTVGTSSGERRITYYGVDADGRERVYAAFTTAGRTRRGAHRSAGAWALPRLRPKPQLECR